MKKVKTGEMYNIASQNIRVKFIRISNNITYHFDNSGRLCTENNQETDMIPSLLEEWIQVQEPVDFMTAVNSGKRIKPVQNGCYLDVNYWFRERVISLDQINGQWNIED